MAVSVQLPGYNHAAPAVGLAQVLGEGMSAYRGYKQGQLADTENQAKQLQLKQAGLASDKAQESYKQALDPNSPASQFATQSALSELGTFKSAKVAQNPQTQKGLSQLADLIQNGVPVVDPETGQPARKKLNAIEVNNVYSENQFIKNMSAHLDAQAKMEGMMGAAQIKGQSFEVKNQLQANQQYSHEFAPMDSTIAAANRVQGIIDRIKSGELKSTPTLTTDLSNALGSMFNNGKAATVSGSEHAVAGMTSLEGAASKKYGWISGQPMNTITPEQLQQLSADVSALRGEYIGARKNAFESWIEGVPQQFRAPLTSRYTKLSGSSAAPEKEAGKGPGGAMSFEQFTASRKGGNG